MAVRGASLPASPFIQVCSWNSGRPTCDGSADGAAFRASRECKLAASLVVRGGLCRAIFKDAATRGPALRRIHQQLSRVISAGSCMDDVVQLELRQVGRLNALHEEVLDLLHDLLAAP